MPSFNQEQRSAIAYVIRTQRPGWAYPAVMNALEVFANENRPVADVVLAAMRAAQDPKAQAPAAIGFDQYWAKAGKGGNDDGTRRCRECLVRKPIGHMATTEAPWTCQTCAGR